MARQFDFRGMDLTSPLNRIANGFCALAVNVRAYLKGGFTLRNPLSAAVITVSAAINNLARLNDTTPAGPVAGYTIITSAGTALFNNSTSIATGLSGNQVSLVPFRPNASVQPWMYVGDSAPMGSVTLNTTYLLNGLPVSFPSNGMMKVRSDGLIYKMGIEEPQLAPSVSTQNTSVTSTASLLATAIPWTNYAGANPTYNYGESNGYPDPTPDGTAPFTVNVANASTITITALSGTATINGNAASVPTTAGPSTGLGTNPGHYVMQQGTGHTPPASATVVIGAFTNGNGNVVSAGVAPLYIPSVVDVGAVIGVPNAITVPFGAQTFQIGINSTGNTFSANSGSFALSVTVTTNALPSVLSSLGTMNIAYWGDSSTSDVANYYWKNADDPSGSGPVRSVSNAVGNTPGNSFIFDATFTAGIPALPGTGSPSTPMEWTQLNPDSVAIGAIPVYTPAIKGVDGNTAYQNFNFCLTGQLYVPAPGNYTFVLTYHDDVIWGIKGATLVSATAGAVKSINGQTITVAEGYPLLPRVTESTGEGGGYGQTTVVVNFGAAGTYGIEIDYDYWYHSGRILLLEGSPTPLASPTIIPPLPLAVRTGVSYACKYRSSATGAQSNPGPETTPETIPVLANTVSCPYSPDPQVDKVDYYRQDSGLANYTYVATGPNTNPPTPITDALSDLAAATNQIMATDDFEPFPSIDLPRSGTCSVSGGVITANVGPGFDTFNVRWLAGTVILIGAPTQLAYTFIARPTSATSVTIPGVPDGTDLVWNIAEPILAAQPLPYLFGPTDNINYSFAVGDPLRPGTLYWCEGSNLDSAPDTNQMDVTDPSEPLVNGVMSAGRGVLFSITRAWVIMPNFFNALATVNASAGSTWTLQATSINRGLFIPRCLAVEGGGRFFFRVEDGIHMSPGGLGSKSITDDTLYPLFAHEGSVAMPVIRNGITIYPPDDTKPSAQQFSISDGYLYYDYMDSSSTPRTLVFDIESGAWAVDVYAYPITAHTTNTGESFQGTLAGGADGVIRSFSTLGTEFVAGTVITPAIGGAGFQSIYECTVEYSAASSIAVSFIAADGTNGSYGPPTVALPTSGGAPTKFTFKVGANKWKWMQFQFQSSDPTAKVYLEGFVAQVKAWGANTDYRPIRPFAPAGGEGAEG